MELIRVDRERGNWQLLISQWEDEAESFAADLSDYALASMGVLTDLAEEAPKKRSGVFALQDNDTFIGMCQLNVALLPGFDGQVLRVRHVIHSPRFDLDDNVTVDDYAAFLAHLFSGVLRVSMDQMVAKHIKFHFRSPAERSFFSHFQEAIKEFDAFSSVEMRGSWLYISKREK